MKSKAGWLQGYNAQVLVEAASGVILAEEVSNHGTDSGRLAPLLDALTANLGASGVPLTERTPAHFSADAGHCSEQNLALLEAHGLDAYVATGRERHQRAGIDPAVRSRTPRRAAMRTKLQTEVGRAIYARRKCITEPVHGLI